MRLSNFALFGYGFRPFFLVSAFHALLMLPVFLMMMHGGMTEHPALDMLRWHIHEMLFGFIAAAIAGFVLTAVPNWTGQRGYAGWPLVCLFMLWCAARIALLPFLGLPLWFGALCDLMFMPSLLACIIPSLIIARNQRNYTIAGMLAFYWLANILCWGDIIGDAATWYRGVDLGFDAVLLLIVVIGGRIVPSFTSSSLHRRGIDLNIKVGTLLDRCSVSLILILSFLHQLSDNNTIIGVVTIMAALAHFFRLRQWHSFKTLHEPLLWILHIAYLWIPIALTLHALSLLADISFASAWRHAFSIGCFSTMIFAIMCRAALGHTGRPLQLARPMVFSFYALIAAGIIRVFIAPLMRGSDNYPWFLATAGFLWCVAFGLYCIVYTPILLRPRIDGRPG